MPSPESEPGALPPEVGIALALALVLANGFFVASEFALVKVRQTRLQEMAAAGRPFARQTQGIVRRLDAYLAAAQLGITLASLALGWVAEPAIASILRGPLAALGVDESLVHPISLVVAFATITLLHITVGEQVPKMLAILRPEGWALFVTPGMRVFYVVALPAIWLLNRISNLMVRLVGLEPNALREERAHTEEELQLLLVASGERGVLDPVEQELASRAMELGEWSTDEIMVPRVEMTAIADDLPVEEARRLVLDSGHDWVPVYRGSIDSVIGVVEWRGLFREGRAAHWSSAVRAAPFVPASVPATTALAKLLSSGSEMAIVLDEYGGTAGLVTIRSLFEAVTRRDLTWEAARDLPGRTPLRVVADAIGANVDAEDTTTIGGYVTSRIGGPASPGDTVALGRWSVEVRRVDDARHIVIAVRLRPPDDLATPAGAAPGSPSG